MGHPDGGFPGCMFLIYTNEADSVQTARTFVDHPNMSHDSCSPSIITCIPFSVTWPPSRPGKLGSKSLLILTSQIFLWVGPFILWAHNSVTVEGFHSQLTRYSSTNHGIFKLFSYQMICSFDPMCYFIYLFYKEHVLTWSDTTSHQMTLNFPGNHS